MVARDMMTEADALAQVEQIRRSNESAAHRQEDRLRAAVLGAIAEPGMSNMTHAKRLAEIALSTNDIIPPMAPYRLWVNADSTILIRVWPDGQAEMATRPERGATWGPPLALYEERVA